MVVKEVVKHSVQRTASVLGVLSVVGVIGFLGWAVYAGMIKPVMSPERTNEQHAQQINNPTYSPKPGLGGCAHMTIYENYGKEKK